MRSSVEDAKNQLIWLQQNSCLSEADLKTVEEISRRATWTIRNEVSQLIGLRCKYDTAYHVDLLEKAIEASKADTIRKLTLKASYLEAIVDFVS